MPDYTQNNIVDILVLGECRCNYQRAELYCDRFLIDNTQMIEPLHCYVQTPG